MSYSGTTILLYLYCSYLIMYTQPHVLHVEISATQMYRSCTIWCYFLVPFADHYINKQLIYNRICNAVKKIMHIGQERYICFCDKSYVVHVCSTSSNKMRGNKVPMNLTYLFPTVNECFGKSDAN